MTFTTRTILLVSGYIAVACASVFSPSQFWDTLLNVAVPLATGSALVFAFHFRSTVWFAFSIATATATYIVTNYGGYLFGDLIPLLLGESTEALYFQDIVYNHLCLVGGGIGAFGGYVLTRFTESERTMSG